MNTVAAVHPDPWVELSDQAEAVRIVREAAAPDAANPPAHSWLITGPPGSGRSTLAFAFAAALIGPHDSDESTWRQVAARTHPDLGVLGTEGVLIKMDDVKTIVSSSQFSPSVGRHRVMVVEDADRMTERTSNVLLKALEEPPPRTIWILCAPSEVDLLPTIRSRVRTLRLRVPAVEDVAELIVRRDGVDRALAERAARHAQSHIGMAHRLATNAEARARRESTLRTVLAIRDVSDAVRAASALLELATEDAKAVAAERDADEREATLRSLGVEPGGTVPPALRSQVKALEDDQKRRSTRNLRDGLDRILVDLLSLYRDALMLQLAVPAELVNDDLGVELRALAESYPPAYSLAVLDALSEARERIEGNVAPLLALEAALIALTKGRTR